MEFEWDSVKNQRNIEKHGIDFTDAVRIFERPTLTVVDNRRNYGEKRIAAMGTIRGCHLVRRLHRSRRHLAYYLSKEGKSP